MDRRAIFQKTDFGDSRCLGHICLSFALASRLRCIAKAQAEISPTLNNGRFPDLPVLGEWLLPIFATVGNGHRVRTDPYKFAVE